MVNSGCFNLCYASSLFLYRAYRHNNPDLLILYTCVNKSLISLYYCRFRMRYSTLSNCYYLHWDNTVCKQLARIDGLENGAQNIFGLQRIVDRDERMVSVLILLV